MTSILRLVLVPFTRFANDPAYQREIIVQHTLSLFCTGIQPTPLGRHSWRNADQLSPK
jgi:hypothetical protein